MDQRTQYRYLMGKLTVNKEAQDKAHRELESLAREESILKGWSEELKAAICPECDGHGKVRVFEDQSRSYNETCERCKGTGLRPQLHPIAADPERILQACFQRGCTGVPLPPFKDYTAEVLASLNQ